MSAELQQIDFLSREPQTATKRLIAESIFTRLEKKLKQDDQLEDLSSRMHIIKDLKETLKRKQLQEERIDISTFDYEKLGNICGLDSNMDTIELCHSRLLEILKSLTSELESLGPRLKDQSKNKKNDQLLFRRIVVGMQSQARDYSKYKETQKLLSDLPFGLKRVYNDLRFRLRMSKSYEWNQWYGYEMKIDQGSIEFANGFDSITLKFTIEGDDVICRYLDKTTIASKPYDEFVAKLLQFDNENDSVQKMEM
eukprot:NODE_22_length_42145_cov_1.310612.p22 type:complete len:253 gc:universal NODE_22_length_42145_cov_1.310612:25785-26543(+)